jgi:hypothetical protein
MYLEGEIEREREIEWVRVWGARGREVKRACVTEYNEENLSRFSPRSCQPLFSYYIYVYIPT